MKLHVACPLSATERVHHEKRPARQRSEQDIGIADGKVVAIGANLSGSAKSEIDARDLTIFPGVIDAHVHFNEPGRTDWEGFATGSRAPPKSS